MGRSSKKKKEKRADFQKVKLKVGKKLKKTQDTDSSFRSRKIVLRDQITKSDSGVADPTFVPSNLQEACHHMRHHKRKARKEAILALKKMLTEKPELVSGNLALILSHASPLLLEDDGGIREVLCSLVKLILVAISPAEFRPHFPLFVQHLRCALSHLQLPVKLHALECMEMLLLRFPELAKDNRSLFLGFLDAIPSLGGKCGGGVTSASDPILNSKAKRLLVQYAHLFVVAVIFGGADYSNADSLESRRDECPILNINTSLDEVSNTVLRVSLLRKASLRAGPFDFSVIYSDRLATDIGTTLFGVADDLTLTVTKLIPFLHSVWVELTASDSPCRGLTETRTFSEESMRVMVQIAKTELAVVSKCNEMLRRSGEDESAEELRQQSKRCFGLKSFISSYSKVFPCVAVPGFSEAVAQTLNSLISDLLLAVFDKFGPKSARKFWSKTYVKCIEWGHK